MVPNLPDSPRTDPAAKKIMTSLVIVESPAKAKTLSRILGPGYTVEASYGHVRDLPEKADQIPARVKKEPWAGLGPVTRR